MNLLRKKRNSMRPITTFSYQLEVSRRRNRRIIAEEFLSFIGMLYQDQIESGYKRIKDFKDMTMFDIQHEIILRTDIIARESKRKIRRQKEEQDRKEKQLLEHLKKMQ